MAGPAESTCQAMHATGNQGTPGAPGRDTLRHIALFMGSLAGGGAERSILNLAGAFAARGHQVDLVLCRAKGPYRNQVPVSINVVALQASPVVWSRFYALAADPGGLKLLARPILLPPKAPKKLLYLPSLLRYLRRERPHILLSAMTDINLVALWARRLARVPLYVAISERNTLSQKIKRNVEKRQWRRRFLLPVIRRTYPWADALIAVSAGVADDLSLTAGIPRERITTIYNPVVTPDLLSKAQAPLDHPWFAAGSPPVVLGAGKLDEKKDFPTLLRTFARVRAKRGARLVILGEAGGAQKTAERQAALMALAARLGVAGDVALPGFVANPFAYMARAAVFVLSSAWEGLPGVLIQALACGCPVVSTDCPSGPAEILEHGSYGPLVPVGDDEALANAILAVLTAPPDRERLRARAAMFSLDRAVDQYLEVLFAKKEPRSAPVENFRDRSFQDRHHKPD
jgi:glycosyltransferase involved in cell wall biosynthesis